MKLCWSPILKYNAHRKGEKAWQLFEHLARGRRVDLWVDVVCDPERGGERSGEKGNGESVSGIAERGG
jgi:hypothetical protein